MKQLIIAFSLFSSSVLMAQQNSELEKKLDALNIPDDKVTTVVSEDKLYIVNTRYSSLVNRHEVTLQGGNNFTADSHLSTQQAAFAYRYHLNSNWSGGLRYTRYSNKLTDAGQRLFVDKKMLPDTDFAFNGQEAFINYNTIYGKLRWTEDTVVYFDQYVALGGGRIKLASGSKNLAFADLGLSFWIGNHMSTRIGFKNEFYQQTQLSGSRNIHNGVGYFEFGYLFGNGDRG
ncbi:MAG: outer membrane beta-barrel domain-containing protein [Bacteriovorax sp.]|nr:outer membrane beta-barrel domain-containing protein [Bacteriovorax sp.]